MKSFKKCYETSHINGSMSCFQRFNELCNISEKVSTSIVLSKSVLDIFSYMLFVSLRIYVHFLTNFQRNRDVDMTKNP